jgi:hypothetical protein
MSKTLWTDPRSTFGSVAVKLEGGAVGDSYTYKAQGRYNDAMTPYGQVMAQMEKLDYILQRTVPNYDELVVQFNAIKDIERSNNDIR